MTTTGPRLRALVVEDEWVARNYLVELLHGSGMAEVVGAFATAEDGRQALLGQARLGVDVAFLDVRLSGGRNEGLDIARELAAMPGAPLVVLATAFNTHAMEAFDLGVADYLLKPFTDQRVEQCLARLQSRRPGVDAGRPQRIAARRQKSLVFFDRADVWAFEAADRLTRVHTRNGAYDVDLSLSAMEASIGSQFARVHRNWLVNVVHIKELERDGDTRIWVGDGVASERRGMFVPVARERAQQVRDALLIGSTGLRRTT